MSQSKEETQAIDLLLNCLFSRLHLYDHFITDKSNNLKEFC